jgi:SAM-dependent methyltransferase
MGTYAYDKGYFDSLTDSWTHISFPIVSRLLWPALERHRSGRALDFGCGCGAYAGTLKACGAQVDGCDISDDAVQLCKDKYDRAFTLADSAGLAADTYDLIFSTEVLEHIRDHRKTLADFHHALRADGTIVLTTTAYGTSVFPMLYKVKNSGAGLCALGAELIRWIKGYGSEAQRDAFVFKWCFAALGGHYHGFSRRKLLQDFKRAGFLIEKQGVFYPYEPIQMQFLYKYTFGGLLHKKEWPIIKRGMAMLLYAAARPLNALLRKTGFFANNIYIIARKTSPRVQAGAGTAH